MITDKQNTYIQSDDPTFSIFIPTWNNLDYLKLCVKSIKQNSYYNNQIIVYVNEGNDGTVDWLKKEKIDHIHSNENIGVCYAVNACRTLALADYLIYLNDDMYVCPDWDKALFEAIEEIGHKNFYISGTLIEPIKTSNPNLVSIIKDYGNSPETFKEDQLLKEYKAFSKNDWQGASWPPSVVHKNIWDKIGGFSIEFSPGMYSDPDFAMKLYHLGIRTFKGVGKSKIYHFGSKSTGRVRKNKGNELFLMKWGITARTFYSEVLLMGGDFKAVLPEYFTLKTKTIIRNKLKRIVKGFSKA